MCGLFGFITKCGHGPGLDTLIKIAAITETRGRHAFGFAWVNPDGRLHHYKRPGPGSDNYADLEAVKDAVAVVGHCRYATHGDPQDNTNNHPHRAGQGWLVHNGQVTNYQDLIQKFSLTMRTACDSEVLGTLMSRMPGSLTARARKVSLKAQGKMAFLGLWNGPARIVFAKNGNPLHVGETRRSLYFGSLAEGLPGKIMKVSDMQVGTVTYDGKLRVDIPKVG